VKEVLALGVEKTFLKMLSGRLKLRKKREVL